MCARSKIGDEVLENGVADNKNLQNCVHDKKAWQRLRKQKRKAMQEKKIAAVSNGHAVAIQEDTTERPKPDSATVPLYRDILAIATEKHHTAICMVYDFFGRWQHTKTYKILFHTTQPAHILVLMAVTMVVMLLNPARNRTDNPDIKRSPVMSLIYLCAFMMHFGAQMWMTFVSGLSLYFAIPRHTFGQVQQVLFPRYFGLNSFLSLVTLVVFVKLHPASTWDGYMALQVGSMVFCFLLELLIRLYLAPPLLSLIAAKIAMEKAAGVGLEVGRHDPGPLAKCPHYVKVHRAFRKVHMSIAIGNLMTMVCTALHLLYLANKLCVL